MGRVVPTALSARVQLRSLHILGVIRAGPSPPGWWDFREQEGASLGPLETLEAPSTTSFRGRGPFHQQAPAAPRGHSTLAPQLPPLVTLLSWGSSRPCRLGVRSVQTPSVGAVDPGFCPPRALLHSLPRPLCQGHSASPLQGPMTPWGSLMACLLSFSPAHLLPQFLHFRPHGWDKPGSLDTWQAEGSPPSWSSRPFCGLGLAMAHSCASGTLHNFCWVRGQTHTRLAWKHTASQNAGTVCAPTATPRLPAFRRRLSHRLSDRGCSMGLSWFPSPLRLDRDHRRC